MSILKELNELAAKYSEDYEKEATIEGAIDAVDKSLESALGALEGGIEDLQDLTYGDGGTAADPAEGSILGRIEALETNSGVLVANMTKLPPEDPEDSEEQPRFVLDKTWQEIRDAVFAVVAVETFDEEDEDGLSYQRSVAPVDSVIADYNSVDPSIPEYVVRANGGDFTTSSPSGYPVLGSARE